MPRPPLVPTLLLLASAASHAGSNCDAIRDQVDAKVRASGVASFTLQVVDAQAKVGGKVVGTCDLGTRKIVYQQNSASAPAAGKPRDDRILTECKDGSVTYGNCPK